MDILEETQQSLKHREWAASKRWNPFNSYKLLAQVYRWRKVRPFKRVPQPALVTVDPINVCNNRCVWCNSEFILDTRNRALSNKALGEIADFLPKWRGCATWEPGVEAVCIAGGGEPLLNKETGFFIEKCTSNRIEVGVVTNGTLIGSFVESLSKCTWVGVSVDAGRAETFKKLKRVASEDIFSRIINNIVRLVNYSKRHKTLLASEGLGYGVSYKYLLHPENVREIYEAARLAKSVGCRGFHLRPASNPWNKLGSELVNFASEDLEIFVEQMQMARELEDENFSIYGVTHKFDEKLNPANYFANCYAVFMSAVFMPRTAESQDKDAFTFGLCCDRRGDAKLELARNIVSACEIEKLWGSKKHWEMFNSIKVEQECPRCTYQPHNQIYEHVILKDNMTYKFI
ncbi:MAG: radical SAM protein [Candidatus Brocadiales bacterium]